MKACKAQPSYVLRPVPESRIRTLSNEGYSQVRRPSWHKNLKPNDLELCGGDLVRICLLNSYINDLHSPPDAGLAWCRRRLNSRLNSHFRSKGSLRIHGINGGKLVLNEFTLHSCRQYEFCRDNVWNWRVACNLFGLWCMGLDSDYCRFFLK